MYLRTAFLLIPLFAIAACPQSPGATSDPGSTGTTDVTTGTTDVTTGTTDGSTGDEPTTGATTIGPAPVILETCAEVKADQPGATDGVYTLYVGKDPNKPWMAHCQAMDTAPLEYLPLVGVEEGRNFSQYTAGNGSPGTDVRTHFTHLRIDPITLLVDIDDLTFSSSVGELMHGVGAVTSMPYAVAEGCGGPAGVANVDLVGTPFKLKESFCTAGFEPEGGTVLSMNDQVADLTGGGNCGWSSPSKGDQCTDNPQGKNSGFVLDLEYMQADAYDQAAQAYCEHNLQCLPGVFPDLASCIAEWQGYKTDDPDCNAAYTAVNNCLATQSCDDLALSVYESMFGDCSDEVMAKKMACP